MVKKIFIEDCHKLAESKGGKFLSPKYSVSGARYEWQCANGHIWQAQHNNIFKGGWCPECAGLKKKSIEECHKLAESKGGKCLSTGYINNSSKLIWECSKGHAFQLSYHGVYTQKRWCKQCNRLEIKSFSNKK